MMRILLGPAYASTHTSAYTTPKPIAAIEPLVLGRSLSLTLVLALWLSLHLALLLLLLHGTSATAATSDSAPTDVLGTVGFVRGLW